jgi:NACHT domain- and WD repeat-containing protein
MVTRTFRVFVSSTFADLKDERNALQEEVYPRLRALCLGGGARFQAVDLRWGVSEEAALDQQTVSICLDEIDRCRRTTPRPNFVVLLGERYGWRPPPPTVAAPELETIVEVLDADERRLVRAWYRKDENAAPAQYRLTEREGEYEDPVTWSAVERELRAALAAGAGRAGVPPQERIKYEASATELEIVKGMLEPADAPEHVFCFIRAIRGLPADGSAPAYVDTDEHGEVDREARDALKRLKDEIRARLPAQHVLEYEAQWRDGAVSLDHLPDLCADVLRSLAATIEGELSRLERRDTVDAEASAHVAFGAARMRTFVGRERARDRLAAYGARGEGRSPLIIVGASGSGKTALAARAAADAAEARPEGHIVARFIGATARSSDGRILLQDLCREIARAYGTEETSAAAYQDLVTELPRQLALATSEQPLLVVIDALDQLPGHDPARDLGWVPIALPPHVGLVLTTLPGKPLASLRRRLAPKSFLELEPMSPSEGDELLGLWLAESGRRLQPWQRDEVLTQFARTGLPLHLKLAFEEARHWRSDAPVAETTLEPSIAGIVRRLFARLSADEHHGATLVERSLAYLGAARDGLTEDELLDVLSRDDDVMKAFRTRSPRSPSVERLPPVVWSRLYFDLEPYLTERRADGASLLAFYHRQLADVVTEDYLAGPAKRERHRRLARFFEQQELEPASGGRSVANLRKLSELPYQETLAELWDELYSTLTDFRFLELKISELAIEERADARGRVQRTFGGVFLLQDDFDLALRAWPAGRERAYG